MYCCEQRGLCRLPTENSRASAPLQSMQEEHHASPRTNRFLESLSSASRHRLLATSKEVDLPIRTPLEEQENAPKYAYFMTSGIASVVIYLADGGSAEVAVIGREGFTGALSLLGPATPLSHCFVQMDGTAYRIPFADVKAAFLESQEIRSRTLEFIQQQTLTMSQIAACNKLHEAEARLSRWLLMVQDRVEDDVLHLTQDFLAQMLGSRRPTVALAAGALQRAGFIEYRRGKVRILSREDLMTAACDCYGITQPLVRDLYKLPLPS